MNTERPPSPEERAQWLHNRQAPKDWLIITKSEIKTLSDANDNKDAQITALREALAVFCENAPWVDNGDGCATVDCLMADLHKASKSISAPPPAVVPLEDVRPLVEALTEMGNSCSRFEMWVIAKEALATFTAKRPLDAIAWMPLPDMPKSLVTGKDGKQSCAYCNKLIKPGQPTVPDEFGEPGARMHIGCDAADQDGQDLDRDHGDS